MIKPHFFAVLVFGKSPESLILLDLITTNNTFPSHFLTCSVDVKDLVFRSFDKVLSFFLDPLLFKGVRSGDISNPSRYDGLLILHSLRFRIAYGDFTPFARHKPPNASHALAISS